MPHDSPSKINSFCIIGRLAHDPRADTTSSGVPSVTLKVKVPGYTKREGRTVERGNFIPVTRYGKAATQDLATLKKGAAVQVSGELRSWYIQTEKRGGITFVARTLVPLDDETYERLLAENTDPSTRAAAAAEKKAASGELDEWLAAFTAHDDDI